MYLPVVPRSNRRQMISAHPRRATPIHTKRRAGRQHLRAPRQWRAKFTAPRTGSANIITPNTGGAPTSSRPAPSDLETRLAHRCLHLRSSRQLLVPIHRVASLDPVSFERHTLMTLWARCGPRIAASRTSAGEGGPPVEWMFWPLGAWPLVGEDGIGRRREV